MTAIELRVHCAQRFFTIFVKTTAIFLFFSQFQCRLYKILPTKTLKIKNMLKEYPHVFPFVLSLTKSVKIFKPPTLYICSSNAGVQIKPEAAGGT